MYANQKKYSLAISDFNSALKINPDHRNASLYLDKTTQAYQKEKDDQNNLVDGNYVLPSNFTPLKTIQHNQSTNTTTITQKRSGNHEYLLPLHDLKRKSK